MLQSPAGLALYELEALPHNPVHRKTAKAATATTAKSDHIPAG